MKTDCPEKSETRDAEGYVLVLVALLAIPLFVMVAFAVDVASWYVRGERMQAAADGAALGGTVWLPDLARAESEALAVAQRNGFIDGVNGIDITVQRVPTNPRRLQVDIRDTDADRYFSSVVLNNVQIQRQATAEYVRPVPLGSPRNYFGTGDLLAAYPGTDSEGRPWVEYYWSRLGGHCRNRELGDNGGPRFKNNFINGPGDNARDFQGYCALSGTIEPPIGASVSPAPLAQNEYWKQRGHEFTIEVPGNLSNQTTQSYGVWIYDPAYTGRVAGRLDEFVAAGYNKSVFGLYSPDATPLDDTDNPPTVCSEHSPIPNARKTAGAVLFDEATVADPVAANGPNGGLPSTTAFGQPWGRFCTIPLGAPSGRYILRAQNTGGPLFRTITGAGANPNDSYVNDFSLLVQTGTGSLAPCDSRATATCAKVSAKDSMAIRANVPSSTARFYLAEIGTEHAGKQMVITLFDLAEGGQTVQFLNPSNGVASFDWSVINPVECGQAGGGVNVNVINVTGNKAALPPGHAQNGRYSDCVIRVTIDLPANYAVIHGTRTWWKIDYAFSASVFDGTTWAVTVLGDPVRLTPDG